MKNIAFIYPGQGSQYVGMGKDLYEEYGIVKNIFEKASISANKNIAKLCFESSMEELTKTENTQPCIITLSHAITELLSSENIIPKYSMGLSLGEYSSLVQANKINFEQAIPLVINRAKFMQNACINIDGGMKACIGLNQESIQKIIDKKLSNKKISIANINSSEQIILTGLKSDLDEAEDIFLENGVKRYMNLQVSGPFHSTFLEPAYIELKKYLSKNLKFNNFKNLVISNFTSKPFSNEDDVFISELAMQVKSSVKFYQSIEYLINECNVDTFIEIGPGKTTSNLIKKINKDVKLFNVENIKTYKNILEELKGAM